MRTFIADIQAVTGTEDTLFQMIQHGPQDALITLHNSGSNTINYRFQQLIGATWTDIDTAGGDLNTTLTGSEVKQVELDSDYPKVRLLGYAANGATLDFAVSRSYSRVSGGAIPIITL